MIYSWELFEAECHEAECGLGFNTFEAMCRHIDETGHPVTGQLRTNYFTENYGDDFWRRLAGAPLRKVER